MSDRTGRLPFQLDAQSPRGGAGRLVLADVVLGPLLIDRLELDVTELGTDPGAQSAERFQRRRTRLRALAVRARAEAAAERVEAARRHLAGLGITQVAARLADGYVSVRARAADGLAAADVTLRIQLAHTGTHLRALASHVRIHGHLPTPAPVIADRILGALLGATDVAGVFERPHTRGLCDVEIDLIGALLWALLPPSGWRLPSVADVELAHVRITRGAIEIAFGPAGSRAGDLGVRPGPLALAAAHDLMHSADALLRDGHVEDAMRGYRALLAAGGPDQPHLLERILALAAARPAWFFDGLELARQALGRWPQFAAAHAALASIALAQGDAREAAQHLTEVARLAASDGDADQAALAALAGARLLRVLEPRAATRLYELAFEHDPQSVEAADALADRLADEARWPELVRLLRARASAPGADAARAVALHLRLADLFAHHLADPTSAHAELAAARELAPDDPRVHEMAATILAASDPHAAAAAWREVARLAEGRGDRRTAARANAIVGELLARHGDTAGAEDAWRRALGFDPLQADAIAGLAAAAAARDNHAVAAELYERLRGLGLPQVIATAYELALARSLVAIDRTDEARAALRRATLAGGETAAEAHAVLAKIADGAGDRELAAAELAIAIEQLVDLAAGGDTARRTARAAELAESRAELFDRHSASLRAAARPGEAGAFYHHSASLRAAARPGEAGAFDHHSASLRAAARPGEAGAFDRHSASLRAAARPGEAGAFDHHSASLRAAARPGEAGAFDHHSASLRAAARPGEAGAFDHTHQRAAASAEWERVHELAWMHAPELARRAARALLSRAVDDVSERRWIDAVLATRPPAAERVELLVARAAVRGRAGAGGAGAAGAGAAESADVADVAGALGDVREALRLGDEVGAVDHRRRAHALEAELLARVGDHRGRAQALAQLARLAEPGGERARLETTAAQAWLAADEPATALVHAGRARVELAADAVLAAAPELRRDVLETLGEAAWRQRAWADVIRAYEGLVGEHGEHAEHGERGGHGEYDDAADPARSASERYRLAVTAEGTGDAARAATECYRLAVAAERTGDAERALAVLRPLAAGGERLRAAAADVRGPALQLFAELAERANDPAGAAAALEAFAQAAADAGPQAPTARADAMYRAGELFRRADRADDAVRCLEAALRISEAHLPALDALEAYWRERGDLERVSVILGRKVAATARHPARQKPLLSRLGDLQDQLGRPDVAHATHQRALEIDATWRPSLAYVTERLRAGGQLAAAVGGLVQLSGELPGDGGLDGAQVARDRHAAIRALDQLIAEQPDDDALGALRPVAGPILERADDDPVLRASEQTAVETHAAALARVRGEPAPRGAGDADESTEAGRLRAAKSGALSLRDGARRARLGGRLADAFAALETANHVAPGDTELLRELAELATELGDFDAAVKYTRELAGYFTGGKRGDALLELADLYYDRLDDVTRGRAAMRDAADAFTGTRRDNTLRLLAAETAAHLAWDLAVEATRAIAPERRTSTDVVNLATALMRAGKPADAVEAVEAAMASGKLDDGGALLATLRAEAERKSRLQPAPVAAVAAVTAVTAVAASADVNTDVISVDNTVDITADEPPRASAASPAPVASPAPTPSPEPVASPAPVAIAAESSGDVVPPEGPSVIVSGTPAENEGALALAAAAADGDRLMAAHRANPSDPALLAALLVHLDEREPAARRGVLDRVAAHGTGRAQAMALHELALLARAQARDPIRASALWNKAYRVDPTYTPVWMPYADALAGADELELARDLYLQVAASPELAPERRAWAAERAEVLGRDDAVISGEIGAPPGRNEQAASDLQAARDFAEQEQWPDAIAAAERAADEDPDSQPVLELLERLYIETGDVTAASEAIGRQLLLNEEPGARAVLWRRRAKLYRDSLGRDAEAYRCLKEAHACAPADPEIAYQLRTAAMVRGEWALVASLLYREIAAAPTPRDRGALHVELALIFHEKLDDQAQAQVNFEQALAFDPTIPAARTPLARHYEQLGRRAEAARLYEEAAASARPADRAALLAAAARCREPEATEPAAAGSSNGAATDAPASATTDTATDAVADAAKPRAAAEPRAAAAEPHAAAAAAEPHAAAAAEPHAAAAAEPHATAAEPHAAFAEPRAAEPSPTEVLASRLEAAEAAGDLDGALDLAHQLWRTDQGNRLAFRTLASSHRLSGDLPALTELTTLFTAKAQATPRPADERAAAWLDVARLAEDSGKLGEAARAYDLALTEAPGHVRALDARGNLAFKLGDWATAETIYRDLAPGDSVLGEDEVALRRSIIAEQLSRDADALARAREAAAAAPNRRDLAVRVQELATRLGDLGVALDAARQALALVALDDDDGLLATHFSLVDLYRQTGDLDAAVAQLDRIVRDHPHHARAIEALAEVHVARGDWPAAARYLYQLVPLAPSPAERAERLYQLGETVLVRLGDLDRADDVFLRASDLDPSHVPTLRRLIDVYWRADDPAALVEVAGQLAHTGSLAAGPVAASSLAHALVAAAVIGDQPLATRLVTELGTDAHREIAAALAELGERPRPSQTNIGGPRDRHKRFELATASSALTALLRPSAP